MSDHFVGATQRAAMMMALILAASPATAQERLPDPTERTSIAAQRVGNPTAVARWTLESTLVAEDRRVAVVNGETVTIGDQVRGARVVAIDSYGVRLRTREGTIELTLSDGDPKRIAGGESR